MRRLFSIDDPVWIIDDNCVKKTEYLKQSLLKAL